MSHANDQKTQIQAAVLLEAGKALQIEEAWLEAQRPTEV
jgi:aryl-alcohol dehydrogenase